MHIQESNVFKMLKEGSVQYQIPVYQRKYSWETNQCIKLLQEVIDVSNDKKREKHFVGSIIYMGVGDSGAGILNKYHIIDGQQRLTTLSLLLIALADYAKEKLTEEECIREHLSFREIKNSFLVNEWYANTDEYYKLKLTDLDFKVYKNLLETRCLPNDIEENTVFSNYNILLSELKKKDIDPLIVYKGIGKFALANVSIDESDDAQLVFETVNTTGKELDTADKIRNYILMKLNNEQQKKIYDEYWLPMEKSFGLDKAGVKELENFMRYYVGVLTQDNLPDDYYDIFKDYHHNMDYENTLTAVKKIFEFSKHYKLWIDVNETSIGFKKLLYRIKLTNQYKLTPAILQIIHNKSIDAISEEDASEMLKIIESYVVRREMYGRDSKTAAYIKIQRSTDSVDNLINCIHNLTDNQSMPTDKELQNVLLTRPLFKIKHKQIGIWLERMEQNINKDYRKGEHSIEHIMPQKIYSHEELYARNDISIQTKEELDWANDLGDNWKDIQEKYVHTIGNLTLTGYNSPYQNYRFSVKRDMENEINGKRYGYKFSPINLSSSLAKLEKFTEEEIVNRCKEMVTIITQVWKYPNKPLSK